MNWALFKLRDQFYKAISWQEEMLLGLAFEFREDLDFETEPKNTR